MTAWADIISASIIQIDDIRLQEQLKTSPALFFRRMSDMVRHAMALLNRPPELLRYLQGGMTEPLYAEVEWVSDGDSLTAETEIDTGFTGADLCSVVSTSFDPAGNIEYVPYTGYSYDKEAGVVTFRTQEETGIQYLIDLYTDGSFSNLTISQMRLFALAIAMVWDERFSRNWLDMIPKIHDDNFDTVNEANYLDKSDKRLHANRVAFNDELKRYEQLCAYTGTLAYPGYPRKITLI